MPDIYSSLSPSLSSPAIDAQVVVPSNTTVLNNVTRAIYVGTAGDLKVELLSGVQVTFVGAPAGAMLPIRARKVLTGTTAGALLGLW